LNRRGFLASSVSVAAAPALGEAQGVPGGTHRVERRADFDERAFDAAVGRPAQIRQVYEALTFLPGVFGSITNSLNGLQFGFGYSAGETCVALAGHGQSAVYGYSDYIWQKYRIGRFFKLLDEKGAPISTNVFLPSHAAFDESADPDDPSSMYHDTSIQMLQRRGLIVLTCHTAVEEQSRAIAQRGFAPAGMSGSDIAADILTHLIPGALVVPSMVATIAVLQNKYGYSYLTPA
jgi:intracellular sulfur oxidation DsrE/DsrF family protein